MANETPVETYVEWAEEEVRGKKGLNLITVGLFLGLAVAAVGVALLFRDRPLISLGVAAGGVTLALFVALMPRVANEWERAVVLRLGRFRGTSGPGVFWIIPFVERVALWADLRVRTTTFAAEKTLTADTVPVDVDAVLFWQIHSAEQAILAVEDYQKAVSWAAQTALRDIIGKTHLADMLTGREAIDDDLKGLIDARTHDWGIVVKSVEIRDVTIPPGLEDAMSKQAQALREKQARVILGDAEVEVAAKFEAASARYANNPTAFQLRAMNILYEGLKEQGSLMIVPTGMVESLSVGGAAGLASLRTKGGGGHPDGGAPPSPMTRA